jgi:excisionase family DNA binding protein
MQTSAAYVSPKEAAEHLGLSIKTIYNWIQQGRLPSYKTGAHRGGRVLIKLKDVEGALQRND